MLEKSIKQLNRVSIRVSLGLGLVLRLGLVFNLSSTHLRGHELKLYKPRTKLDVRKYFLSIRVIDEWNSLPESVIYSNTVNTFKAQTDCIFKKRGYI